MFCRKSPVFGRHPHPDPRVEAKVQRILSLQRRAQRAEVLLDNYHAEVRKIQATVRRNAGGDRNKARSEDLNRITGEITRLNSEVAAVHDQVEALMTSLSDDDLLLARLDRAD